MTTRASERRERLKAVYEQARECTACPLHQTRTTVVFGAGNADADLMFIGEAPGANEDTTGLPFVGAAGKLLDKLLTEIGLERADVFITNTVKCLRYTAMVQLGDGSWERIGRLVRSRYGGEVMSVDSDGHLVPRRVTGWHASPLAGRRVFHLSFVSSKPNGPNRAGVELTGDHPVLTERGYVPVQELRAGDRVATGQGLSDLAHDVTCGSVLGDASIGRGSAAVTMSHSARQAEYARFKAHLLGELDAVHSERTVAGVANGPPVYDVIHVRTRAHRALRTLRGEFYAERKFVPRWLATTLNARMLAFWFMDDGYMRIRGGGRRPAAEIASLSFDDADLQILLAGLARLGLPAKALRGRIHFDVNASERLSELIAPYVPDEMRYKLVPDVAARVPFDATRLERGPARVQFDEVESVDITDRPRGDVTFFCIDVEENHNFVTAGGVVHNCRPPGNRDPHPHEIETCHRYLAAQVELIEPRVICTLGNFSTKLLRGDPTGISKLHGHDEVRTIGPRALRLLPLYHPAAALYTPSNLQTLRDDFARIPELLALDVPPQPAVDPAPVASLEPDPGQPGKAQPQVDTEAAKDNATPQPESQLDLF